MTEQAATPSRRPASELPSAFDALEGIVRTVRHGAHLAVFVDYDGTLTPIVSTPELAVLHDETREVLRRLARVAAVAVVSGRDLPDIVERVALPGLVYAGSHGFEVQHADGSRNTVPGAAAYLGALEEAATLLAESLRDIPGARLERKRFALAAHYRLVPEHRVPEVHEVVAEVATRTPGLRVSGGKRVLELRPDLDWHKGRAVRAMADDVSALHAAVLPVYLGDDETDEDAFRELALDGAGIVVGEPERTAARYRLADVPDVIRWLDALAGGLTQQG